MSILFIGLMVVIALDVIDRSIDYWFYKSEDKEYKEWFEDGWNN